ncbi:MAG: hypothetical protein L3K02_08340 [Thermoplasmata archaeon]|nr:hypothetical protein [Thermoplasmata archaeon]
MNLSHRDHRMDNSLRQSLFLMLALIAGLSVLSFMAPWTAVGLAALLGLAVLGGLYVVQSDRTIAEYARDLRSVHGGGQPSKWMRVEVRSEVEWDRHVGIPGRRSPNARPRSRPEPGTGPAH